MITVWKFPLQFVGEQTIIVPQATELFHVEAIQRLSVNVLAGNLDATVHYGPPAFFMWGRVWDSDIPRREARRIFMCGTGHQAPSHPHLATTVCDGGAYVWHFFAKQVPEPVS